MSRAAIEVSLSTLYRSNARTPDLHRRDTLAAMSVAFQARQNVFSATAYLLKSRGFSATAPVGSVRRADAVTLHYAMRSVCGIEPAAWLPAYADWDQTTAP